MRTLNDEDVLRRVPGVQAIPLGKDKMLVRHGKGSTIRPALPLEDVQAVFDRVDGQTTVAEIVAGLQDIYEPEDVRALLQAFLGEWVVLAEDAGAGQDSAGPVVYVWGEGKVLDQFLDGVRLQGLASPQVLGGPPVPAHLADADLLVMLPHGHQLRTVWQVQRAAMKAGVPTVGLTGEAGQVLMGPPTLVGHSACVACVRLAPFGKKGGPLPQLLGQLGNLRTDLEVPVGGVALSRLVDMVAHISKGSFDGFGQTTTFHENGAHRETHLTPLPECPLCSGQRVAGNKPFWEKLAAQALRSKHGVLKGFAGSRKQGVVREKGHVGILGGGTAGYLAALALRKYLPEMQVTLLESKDIPIIGVGEATTPLLAQFLHADLDVDPVGFFEAVQPTFKLGIDFRWNQEGSGFFYPFGTPRFLEPLTYDGSLARQSLAAMMMGQNRLPLIAGRHGQWLEMPEMAYHLDNKRFSAYLATEALSRGVQHRDCRIVDVVRQGDEIKALRDEEGREYAFDFYVDCSGFRGYLMGDALASPFESYGQSLLADRAVVGAVPLGGPSRSYTRATAMDAGWYWDIPQWDERHLGYVYCSAFSSDEAAEAALRARHPDLGPTRVIRFQAGRRKDFLRGNVAALGNAYGFVEPLESTSLHMLVRQIGLLVQALSSGNHRPLQATLNKKVGGWWDYLRWFLALHYKFNAGMDTAFWRHCRAEVDIRSHENLVALFKKVGPLSAQPLLAEHFDVPDPLWGPEGVDTLLLGQGVNTRLPTPAASVAAWQRWCSDSERLVGSLQSQDGALAVLRQNPDLVKKLGEMFAATGPAISI